jgi:hypothetical protein
MHFWGIFGTTEVVPFQNNKQPCEAVPFESKQTTI